MNTTTRRSKMAKKEKKRERIDGLAIPGGLFLGMGVGFLLGNLVAWMFIGLGVGFIAMLLVRMIDKSKRK